MYRGLPDLYTHNPFSHPSTSRWRQMLSKKTPHQRTFSRPWHAHKNTVNSCLVKGPFLTNSSLTGSKVTPLFCSWYRKTKEILYMYCTHKNSILRLFMPNNLELMVTLVGVIWEWIKELSYTIHFLAVSQYGYSSALQLHHWGPSVKEHVLQYTSYWVGHAVASLYCGDISHHRNWELPRSICRHSHSMTSMAMCHHDSWSASLHITYTQWELCNLVTLNSSTFATLRIL